MIKELTSVANKLDSLGLTKEADVVDRLIRKVAARVINPGDLDYDPIAELGGEDGDIEEELDYEPRKRSHTVVKLYKKDGETPEKSLKHEMVGGTGEDPILEYVEKDVILPVEGEIGTRFDIKTDNWSLTKVYEITEFGSYDSPGKAVRVE